MLELEDVDDESDAAKTSAESGKNSFVTLDLSDLPPRYRDVCPIGCGSRGLIFSALDQQSLRRLAVKKLTVKRENKTEFLRQVLREIRILHRLEHQNILKIYHVLVSTTDNSDVARCDGSQPEIRFTSDGPSSIACLYIGMELMDIDLRNIISKSNLSFEYIKLFMYQILRGVKYMHSANVMHRDLNPSNIFVNMDTLVLKIGDFGVSRLHDSDYDHTYHLSMPLTTKYYQAPELLLHPHHYTKGIDVWATGCIFIEMFKGSPAFPGDHVLEQMNFILESTPVTTIDWLSVVNAGCQDTQCCAPAFEYPDHDNAGCPKKPLEVILPEVQPAALNLIKQLLCFDAKNRIPAEDALNHPYFLQYSNPVEEPYCSRPFQIEDELDEYSTCDLENMLQNESYSVTSSFSRSMDMTVPLTGTLQSIEDWNSLRVNSGTGLVTNGSYRHLLSLANTTQSQVLSESEARTMACDFDYGVQIHECSFNKDRMSIDFRPIVPETGCFDPYKWNNVSSSGPLTSSERKNKDSRLGKASSSNQNHVSDRHFDTGYSSSYCSSTMTNHSLVGLHRVSTGPSSAPWSFSSPDVSSDQEQRLGCATPDSTSSIQFHTGADYSSAGNSPVLIEDVQNEPTFTSHRHTETSVGHSSSSRRHHHHHHHHSHHHHHHHKHKTRQAHRETASVQAKPVNDDSSVEQSDCLNGVQNNANDTIQRGHAPSRKSRSLRDKGRSGTPESPQNIVIVTDPQGEEVTQFGNRETDTYGCKSSEEDIHQVKMFDKKEAIHEHFNSNSEQKCVKSAFNKYIAAENNLHTASSSTVEGEVTVKQPVINSTDSIPLSFFAPEAFSEISEEMWKQQCIITTTTDILATSNDKPKQMSATADKAVEDVSTMQMDALSQNSVINVLDFSPGRIAQNYQNAVDWQLESHYPRPRTWSEGCYVSSVGDESSAHTDGIATCTLVHKIRSQFSNFFCQNNHNDGCLPAPAIASCLPVGQSDITSLGRMRHFSDDRRYVLASRACHPTVKLSGSPVDLEKSDSKPPATCSSAESIFPGSIRHPHTRVECPF